MRSPHIGGAVLPSISGTASAPIVSVCLPVFNGEKYLKEAVTSVLSQSYQNFELLVFDDASTDGSWRLLNTFDDPRIHLHRNERNLGPEGNWNQALEAAKGTYVKLFHQDDLLASECLVREVEILERNPSVVLVFSSRHIIRANGKHIMIRGTRWNEGEISGVKILRGCVISGTNLVGEPSAVLFRASAAHKIGRFDASLPYVIDLDYWIRLLNEGTGYYLRTPLVSFRVSSQQWSAMIGSRQSHEFIDFVKRLESSGQLRSGALIRLWCQFMARLNGILRSLVSHLLPQDL